MTSQPATSLTGLGLELSTAGSGFKANKPEPQFSMRSSASMYGLATAEFGQSTVVFDKHSGSFREGDCVTPRGNSRRIRSNSSPLLPLTNTSLARHGTLIDASQNPKQLQTILGKSNRCLQKGAQAVPVQGAMDSEPVTLELAKSSKPAVQCDISLQNPLAVQGTYLKGLLHVKVRSKLKKESPINIDGGKLRVVGFESILNDNQPFFQCSAPLSEIAAIPHTFYDSPPDNEGFCYVSEGTHVFPFAFLLPLDTPGGNAKGSICLGNKVSVRYIVLISFKIKDTRSGKISIVHFYRNVSIWPRIDPSSVLTPANHPIKATEAKSLFLGGTGEITLVLSLHRVHWIAGQRCYIKVEVNNETRRTVREATLTLVRKTTLFKSFHKDDSDPCPTSTVIKPLTRSVLEMGKAGTSNHVSARGWWTGVSPASRSTFSLSLLIPANAISVSRGRLIEVEYSLVVKLNAGGSSVDASLPLTIISFLSVDPPPSSPLPNQFMAAPARLDEYSMEPIDEDAPLWSPHEADDSFIAEVSDVWQPDFLQVEEDDHDHSLYVNDLDAYDGVQLSRDSTAANFATQVIQPAEKSARFADLYHASLYDLATCASDSPPETDEQSINDSDCRTPARTPSPLPQDRSLSPFALRVQEKLEALGQTRRYSDCTSQPSLSYSFQDLAQETACSHDSFPTQLVQKSSSCVEDSTKRSLEPQAPRPSAVTTIPTLKPSLQVRSLVGNSVQAKIREFEAMQAKLGK